MNTTVAEGVELAKAVVAASAEVPADVKLIIAPPFTHLYPVAEVVKGTAVTSRTASKLVNVTNSTFAFLNASIATGKPYV